VEGREFLRSFLREFILMLDLLSREFHEVFVDDISDVFEVDGKRDDLRGAPSISIIEALAGQLGYIEFCRPVQRANRDSRTPLRAKLMHA
jgi:hypothetical protein